MNVFRACLDKVNNNNNNLKSKKLCGCPGAEPGKIDIDVSAHLSECWIRKRLLTRRYTINTSVTPEDFKDGYCLGVAV